MEKRLLMQLAAALLCVWTPPSKSEDLVLGRAPLVFDTSPVFSAVVELSILDSAPQSGINAGGAALAPIDFLALPGTVQWFFDVWYVVTDFGPVPSVPPGAVGAQSCRVGLRGIHALGPHVGVDMDPNVLPAIVGGTGVNIGFWSVGLLANWGIDAHPPHRDIYGVGMVVQAASPGGPAAPFDLLGGSGDVLGLHVEQDETLTYSGGHTVGSSALAGGRISFNAESRLLSFVAPTIDILNSNGKATPGIDAAYKSDPILASHLTFTDLKFLGHEQNGGYEFDGGQVNITNSDGTITLEGRFTDYWISDTVSSVPFKNVATLTQITVGYVAQDEPRLSGFVRDFVDESLLLKTTGARERELFQGLALTFLTSADLALATDGFTRSALSIPATCLISRSYRQRPVFLSIKNTADGLRLSWASDLQLQSTDSLSIARWKKVADTSPFVTQPTGNNQFFRLGPQ